MMAGLLAGLRSKTHQNRSNSVRIGVTDSPMASSSIRSHFASGLGLKIRVSAVRFCPWPLRSKINARSEIGSVTDSVPARIRFSGWRDFWRDSERPRQVSPLAEQLDAAAFLVRVGFVYCAVMLLVLGIVAALAVAGAR